MSRKRKNRVQKNNSRRKYIEGVIRVVVPGEFGYAEIESEHGVYTVLASNMHEAMDGDVVRAKGKKVRNGWEAYVVGVVHRAKDSVLGVYNVADPLGVVVPLDKKISHDFFVLPEDDSVASFGVKQGDVVEARIVKYPQKKSAGIATIVGRKGASSELDMYIENLIASYGLPTAFTDEVKTQVKPIEVDANKALSANPSRVDMRNQLCFTIDPVDAKDFDDAVSARMLDDGYEVDVHIADVTDYVRWGTPLDMEARNRAFSVYLVDRVIPMLPEKLSNDICSLRPNEDRLCMSVRIKLNKKGRIVSYNAYESVINSNARLNYDEVQKHLDGKIEAEELNCKKEDAQSISEAIYVLDKVASLRKTIEKKRGALEFETVETKVVLNENHEPVDVKIRKETRATSLVEQAMLLANECVATTLAEHKIPAAYRVHEQPDFDALSKTLPILHEFDLLSNKEGAKLCLGDPFTIQSVLEKVKGKREEYLVSSILLRSQSRAVYRSVNEGHFALGADDYCHFTSPIRRYPDCIVHRALKAYLSDTLHSRQQKDCRSKLSSLCNECSRKERQADACGRDSHKIKLAEMYSKHIGEKYSGIVTGVTTYGLFVALDDTFAEGLLHVKNLGPEWYEYDELKQCLVAESSDKVWRMGQRVAVAVKSCDIQRGHIDFVLASQQVDDE